MKKVLFTANIDRHILSFHVPYLKWFVENGYTVHIASEGNSEIPFAKIKYNVPFKRSPFSLKNLKAYKHLKEIIEKNDYDLIHCHTPMGSVLTRLAARKARKKGTKIVYTAHGFHFYKGAALINWLLYYPVEKFLSRYTDCLITINNEDFEQATKFLKIDKIRLVNGVGVDLNKFSKQMTKEKKMLREQYGYKEQDFILIYVGELSYRKHQDLIIEVVNLLKSKIPNIKLLLVGEGKLLRNYQEQVNMLNLERNIEFLGQRKDINSLMKLSDLSVSTSRQEGLPVNVMEAMATGLPLVVTNCRGNNDLVKNGENGYVIDIDDKENFSNAIQKLYYSEEIRRDFAKANLTFINSYSIETIMKDMEKIYSEVLNLHAQLYKS